RGGADEVIARLPDGYETMLGRRFSQIGHDGVDLSGGEWQKVALSRAFFRSLDNGTAGAQLLILDEPTAALDARAEHELYERFRELTRDKATLLISHRFSTVRMADVIAVMEDGRITELGSHAELIAKGGTYARLYAMQAERYA
ncbi:MAG TPA: ABC transporter ATP-binding protein, partial [Chloroflexota bacterium]|nr:ABC transporter ATP-binding protein [Chloroflexota bacterium]